MFQVKEIRHWIERVNWGSCIHFLAIHMRDECRQCLTYIVRFVYAGVQLFEYAYNETWAIGPCRKPRSWGLAFRGVCVLMLYNCAWLTWRLPGVQFYRRICRQWYYMKDNKFYQRWQTPYIYVIQKKNKYTRK